MKRRAVLATIKVDAELNEANLDINDYSDDDRTYDPTIDNEWSSSSNNDPDEDESPQAADEE